MLISLEMGPNFPDVVRSLGVMGRAVVEACDAGLGAGCEDAVSHLAESYLSGQALKSRTGMLRRAAASWRLALLEYVIGVRENSAVDRYKWLLGDDEMTIKPKNSKFLAIPIGEGLTASGVARFGSPRDVEDGFFVNTGGRLLFGRKRGKRGKFRPLFALVKSVFVQGSGALWDAVDDSLDDITAEMQKEVDKVTGAGS